MGGKTVLLFWVVTLCHYIGVVRLFIIIGAVVKIAVERMMGAKKNLGGKSAGGKTAVAPFIGIYSIIWRFMVLYGRLWSYMAFYGPVWLFGHIIVFYGLSWQNIDLI